MMKRGGEVVLLVSLFLWGVVLFVSSPFPLSCPSPVALFLGDYSYYYCYYMTQR